MKKTVSIIFAFILIINTVLVSNNTVLGDVDYPEVADVYGESAILMEADTGAILYEKNSHEVLYPASITKIMTGLLAIENLTMEDEVVFTGEVVSSLPFDAAKLGAVIGEKMTVRDSLYALLLRSCNDVAIALAYDICENEEEFATLMTERAKQAGALNTNFVNSTGLHDENHYTTAYDMAMITKAAISNPVFCQVSKTSSYDLAPTNKCEDIRTMDNRHKMLLTTSGDYYSYSIAGKTGYTDEAGRTLVTVAKRDGVTLICVIMKTVDEKVYTDTKTLFEYGFNHFNKVNIADNETRFSQNEEDFFTKMSDVFVTTGKIFDIGKSDYVMLPEGASFNSLTYKIEYVKDIADKKVAIIKYYYGDKQMGSTSLVIKNEAKEELAAPVIQETQDTSDSYEFSDIPVNVKILVIGGFVLILLIIYIVYMVKTKEKRRRKKDRKKMFKESRKRFKRRKRTRIRFK